MVMESIMTIESQTLFCGEIAIVLGENQLALNYFKKGNHIQRVLDFYRHQLDFESALQLAETSAPNEISFIAKEYATILEIEGRFIFVFVFVFFPWFLFLDYISLH